MYSSSANSNFNLTKEKSCRTAIWIFSSLVGLLLLAGAGRVLVLIFPASAVALALYLYFRSASLYISFTWWIIFIGNLIRRIIDYQAGYITFGPWGLTSQLVMLISGIAFFKKLPTLHKDGGIPFALSVFSVLYAFLIGFLQNPKTGVIIGTLDWLCPILFGYYTYSNWRQYPILRTTLQKTFFWGVILMGIYGLFQYVVAPDWDRFWLNNIPAVSFGQPEPYKIRIPSSMGSPQSFGITLLAGLILLFCKSNNPLVFFATGVGYLSFFLTMARTAWLSGLAGIPTFLISLKPSIQMRMIVFVLILGLGVVQLVAFTPFAEDIYSRFDTLSNVETDSSFEGRLSGYDQLWASALTQFMGQGFGFSPDLDVRLGDRDSTFFPTLFSLGWFGAIPYTTGIMLLIFSLFSNNRIKADVFACGTQAIVLSVITQSPLNLVFAGPQAVILWGFLGVGTAACKYYSTTKIGRQKNQSLS